MTTLQNPLLSEKEILNHKDKHEIKPAVYFLIHNEEIVYVGQSTNPHSRVVAHAKDGEKVFDEYTLIYCDSSELNTLEAQYIAHFTPRYNNVFAYKEMPDQWKYVGKSFNTPNGKHNLECLVVGNNVYLKADNINFKNDNEVVNG